MSISVTPRETPRSLLLARSAVPAYWSDVGYRGDQRTKRRLGLKNVRDPEQHTPRRICRTAKHNFRSLFLRLQSLDLSVSARAWADRFGRSRNIDARTSLPC